MAGLVAAARLSLVAAAEEKTSCIGPELGDVTMSVHIVYFILHFPRHSMIELQKIHFLALVRAFFVIHTFNFLYEM